MQINSNVIEGCFSAYQESKSYISMIQKTRYYPLIKQTASFIHKSYSKLLNITLNPSNSWSQPSFIILSPITRGLLTLFPVEQQSLNLGEKVKLPFNSIIVHKNEYKSKFIQ